MKQTPLTTSLFGGEQANALLAEPRFEKEWRALQEQCPWATSFQGPDFVGIWFRTYEELYEPVLVLARNSNDELCGLLAVGRDRRQSTHCVLAGAHQAEYQAWLARPDCPQFLRGALESLRSQTGLATFGFKFLPANVPLADLTAGPWTVLTRSHERPLMDLDPDTLAASLRKKSTKSKVNRLKRLGTLHFDEHGDHDALSADLDQIADQYDLRQSGKNGVAPFREDRYKKAFHLNLMKAPELLHASALKLDDTVVASHLGVRTADTVSVGVFALSPFFARHSPGKLLLLMLGQRLAEQGVRYLDLTPGGEWKDRFQTSTEHVTEATVYFSRPAALRVVATDRLVGAAKRLLAVAGVTPERARQAVGRMTAAWKEGAGRPWMAERWFVYELASDPDAPEDTAGALRPGTAADLLDRIPDGDPDRAEFLSRALRFLDNDSQLLVPDGSEEVPLMLWIHAKPQRLPRVAESPASLELEGSLVWIDPMHTSACEQHPDRTVDALRVAASTLDGSARFVAVPDAARRVRELLGGADARLRGQMEWRHGFAGRRCRWRPA